MNTTFLKLPSYNEPLSLNTKLFYTSMVVIPILLNYAIKMKRKSKKIKGEPQLKRNISFTSAAMAMGSWPEERNVCDPVINVALVFPSIEECPSEDRLVSDVIRVMLQYERCAGVPR